MSDAVSSQKFSVQKFSKATARSALIGVQKRLGFRPRHFCLITGAPRSGTTALSAWLSHHPKVAGLLETRVLIALHRFMEEVHDFSQLEKNKKELVGMARRLTYDYFCDQRVLLGRSLILNKEPLEPIAFPDKRYQSFLENVRVLLPEAKFLFMVRDPIATVFSMRQRKWGYSRIHFEPRTFSIEEHVQNWCDCVDCMLQYVDDPNAYICQFGKLLHDPEGESQRILDFLEIRKGKPFQARDTKTIGFSEEECALILERSRSHVEALQSRGLVDLG